MITYTIDGIEYIHISDFASILGRSIQSTRYLCLKGNRYRPLKHIYDGSRILIEKAEITSYPFIPKGNVHYRAYHYVEQPDGRYAERYCEGCSIGDPEMCFLKEKTDDSNGK